MCQNNETQSQTNRPYSFKLVDAYRQLMEAGEWRTDALKLLDTATALVGKGWHKGSACADINGESVSIDDPRRCRYCAYGAMHEARLRTELIDSHKAFKRAIDAILIAGGVEPGYQGATNTNQLFRLNDGLATQDAAVVLMEKAKKLLEEPCPSTE